MAEEKLDVEVVQEGRKNALKDVDAPLRDQIVKKLYSTLEERGIAEQVEALWTRGQSNRNDWMKKQQAFLASWDEHTIPDISGSFAGSSQLHIPMPFIVCKTLHARFMQALWQDPPCHTKARNEASLERVPTVQDTMRYYLLDGANYNKGVETPVDKWVWDWITVGSGIMKWRWDVAYTRFMDVETVLEQGLPKFVVNEEGKEVVVPTFVPVEKEVKRTKKTFDGPVLDLVDAEDIIIVGGSGDPDLADAVLHRQMLTASELWTLVDRKVFNRDAVEKVISGGGDNEEGGVASEVKSQRREQAGHNEKSEDLQRYEVIEAYLKEDVDGSGIASDVIVWVNTQSGVVLRATYLHRISKYGERPFVKADFHVRKGQEMGTGMVELLYPLAKELDLHHNLRIDFGLISVMPFGFYRASSGIDPASIQLEPGALIPVDNPQTDVFFPNLGNRSVFGMQEEMAIQQMIERLTSISDVSLGMIGGQGVTRTASGARMLSHEMNANLDVYLRRLNRGWKKALRYLHNMLQQRIPEGLSYRLTGDDGKDYWRTVKGTNDVQGDFDFEVSPNSSSSNSAIQQDVAGQIMQAVADPLAIQMGCVTPLGYYEAKKNFLQALGVKDFGRYFQKPQGMERQLTPEEEANRVLRGIYVPVTPNSDHQGYIDYFNMIYDDDDLLGQFSEEQTLALAEHAKKHEQMLMALKAMQAQAANAAQMQRNAAMSQQQAPTGMSPMDTGAGSAPMNAGQ